MSAGIDYGMGKANIDTETGIRYGVISQHDISQAWADLAEPDYGAPTCPKCGNEAQDAKGDEHETTEDYEDNGVDYVCHACRYLFDSDEAFADEPLRWSLDDGEYVAEDCLDSDVVVIRSPYYTYAPFCSPCVPGAGDLDNAVPIGIEAPNDRDERIRTMSTMGVKTYCLGHDWFEDGKAPYRVFRVDDDTEVYANGE